MLELTTLTDEALVALVRSKDKNLYAEVIRRYEQKLLRYAMYLVNDVDLAADAVQEGFIKAYINLQRFNLQLKFSSWLYRIVHNQAMNLVSTYKQQVSIDDALEIASDLNLEDALIKKEIKNNLQACIAAMPLLYKAPLTLFFLEEKSYEEISDILRLPMGTVATRINRAKTIVRKVCQKKPTL